MAFSASYAYPQKPSLRIGLRVRIAKLQQRNAARLTSLEAHGSYRARSLVDNLNYRFEYRPFPRFLQVEIGGGCNLDRSFFNRERDTYPKAPCKQNSAKGNRCFGRLRPDDFQRARATALSEVPSTEQRAADLPSAHFRRPQRGRH